MPALPIAECRLDGDGLRAQAARYRRLSEHVTAARHGSVDLEVGFDDGVDLALLREALAVERGCCSLFRLELDEAARRLRIAVDHPEQRPAVDAIAGALGVTAAPE